MDTKFDATESIKELAYLHAEFPDVLCSDLEALIQQVEGSKAGVSDATVGGAERLLKATRDIRTLTFALNRAREGAAKTRALKTMHNDATASLRAAESATQSVKLDHEGRLARLLSEYEQREAERARRAEVERLALLESFQAKERSAEVEHAKRLRQAQAPIDRARLQIERVKGWIDAARMSASDLFDRRSVKYTKDE